MCCVCVFAGRPVMIVVEYVENGSLDSFLRVSVDVIGELKYEYICFLPQVVTVLYIRTVGYNNTNAGINIV